MQKKNIGFFLAFNGPESGGLFTYALAALRVLLRLKFFDGVCVLYSSEQAPYLHEFRQEERLVLQRIKEHGFSWRWRSNCYHAIQSLIYFGPQRARGLLTSLAGLVNPLKPLIKKNRVSLQYFPFPGTALSTGLGVPLITTIHDVQELIFPQNFSPRERAQRAFTRYLELEEANQVICSFEHVRADLARFFPDTISKTQVICLPKTKDWFSNIITRDGVAIQEEVGPPFIYYPALALPHKNHLTLLRALLRVRQEGLDLRLVCTGGCMNEPFFLVLQKQVHDLGLDRVVAFRGVVPYAEVKRLYSTAAMVVIPSLYEAGSGPLLEAMRHAVPVLCSNITSLPETIGDPAFVFDPLNESQIASLIMRLFNDPDFKALNLRNSTRQMRLIGAADSASEFEAVFRSAI